MENAENQKRRNSQVSNLGHLCPKIRQQLSDGDKTDRSICECGQTTVVLSFEFMQVATENARRGFYRQLSSEPGKC